MSNNGDVMVNRTESLLNQAAVILEQYNRHIWAEGGRFNIFSVLEMERLEVRVHSAFLYELLNPLGSHGQSTLYLDAFMNDVARIPDFDLKNVKVTREKYAGTDGRICGLVGQA